MFKGKELTNEMLVGIIEQKAIKDTFKSRERIHFKHRNFMIPSYHTKTFFKAAQEY